MALNIEVDPVTKKALDILSTVWEIAEWCGDAYLEIVLVPRRVPESAPINPQDPAVRGVSASSLSRVATVTSHQHTTK